MFSAIRAFAKSWVAAVLIGLLIVSFAVFGIHDVFRAKISDAVITAGKRTVGSEEFKREFDRYRSAAEQQMGQPIPVDVAAANGFDRQVLNGVATDEAFGELLRRIGVHASDSAVAGQIAKIPAFFDQVSGRFDKKAYQAKLSENGLTTAKFEQSMRDQIASQHVQAAIVGGLRVPRAYAALAAIYALESRDVAYFTLDPRSVPLPAQPTDAQLQAFMKENAAQLTRPEFRVLTVVRFSPALAAAGLAVDEAELKKRYDFRKDTLSTPETRTVVQIPARDAAAAQQVAAALARGGAPDAVAKASGVDAIVYADKPQTAIADRRVAFAAFAMTAGQTAPVQGDLGMAVVKILAVKPGHQVTMAEARPQLEAEIRKDAAAEKVYALSQAYDDAHQKGASLPEAAQKAGVPAETIGPLSQQGRDLQGQPVPGLSQKLVETAFGLPTGGESDVVDAGGGEYFAVRVDKILPPALPTLEEVKPLLIRVWMQRELIKRLQARADGLLQRAKQGESLEAIAASAGAQVQRVANLDRQSAGQNKAFSQDFLGRALNAKPGEAFVAEGLQLGLLVAKVEAVRAGEGPTLARIAEDNRPQMTMTILREMNDSARAAARQKVKVTVNYDRARAAIGLPPLEAKTRKAPEKAR